MFENSIFNPKDIIHIAFGRKYYESQKNIPTFYQKYTDRYGRIPCSRIIIFLKGIKPTQYPKYLQDATGFLEVPIPIVELKYSIYYFFNFLFIFKKYQFLFIFSIHFLYSTKLHYYFTLLFFINKLFLFLFVF